MQLGSRNNTLLGGEHWRAISDEDDDDDDDNDHALGLPRLGQGSALALAWDSSSSSEVAPAPALQLLDNVHVSVQHRLLEKGIEKHKGGSEHFFWCQCHSWWELGHWRAISAIIFNYKKESASKNKALCAWTTLKADNSQSNRRGHLPLPQHSPFCISAEVSLKYITNVGVAGKGQQPQLLRDDTTIQELHSWRIWNQRTPQNFCNYCCWTELWALNPLVKLAQELVTYLLPLSSIPPV